MKVLFHNFHLQVSNRTHIIGICQQNLLEADLLFKIGVLACLAPYAQKDLMFDQKSASVPKLQGMFFSLKYVAVQILQLYQAAFICMIWRHLFHTLYIFMAHNRLYYFSAPLKLLLSSMNINAFCTLRASARGPIRKRNTVCSVCHSHHDGQLLLYTR